MVHSEVKNEYGFSDRDVFEYRQQFGVSFEEARNHFKGIHRDKQRARMAQLVQSGTLEDVLEIVKILMKDY